jgi:MoxR-like ATPase
MDCISGKLRVKIISQVTKALKNGDHVFLVGVPSTGKSKLAKTINESVLNDRYLIFVSWAANYIRPW